MRDTYQQILTVLGYEFANETVQQTYAKVKNLITRAHDISDFSYDVFVSKLNAIDSVLANQTLYDLNRKLAEGNRKIQALDTEIEELQELKKIAS